MLLHTIVSYIHVLFCCYKTDTKILITQGFGKKKNLKPLKKHLKRQKEGSYHPVYSFKNRTSSNFLIF